MVSSLLVDLLSGRNNMSFVPSCVPSSGALLLKSGDQIRKSLYPDFTVKKSAYVVLQVRAEVKPRVATSQVGDLCSVVCYA